MSTQTNLESSIQARLLNYSRVNKREYGQVLTMFALERLLGLLIVGLRAWLMPLIVK
jgi:hypothetical protein